MRFFAIIFILLITNNLALAQVNDRYLDSLVAATERASADTAGMAYCNLAIAMMYQRPVDALFYLDKAIEYSIADNDYKALCMEYSYKGITFGRLGYFDKSFQNFMMQLSIARKHKLFDEYIWANNNIGFSFLILNNPDLAKPYLEEAMATGLKFDDDKILNHIYSNTGWYHSQKRQYDSAIVYYKKSLKIRKTIPFERMNVASSYRDIANVLDYEGKSDEAMAYYRQSLSISDTISKDLSSDVYSHMAKIYMEKGVMDSAYYFADMGLQYAKSSNNVTNLRYSYYIYGIIHKTAGRYSDAEKCFSMQMVYNDSVRNPNATDLVYDALLNKEVERQQFDIRLIQNDSNLNFVVAVVLLVLLGGVVTVIHWVRRKRGQVDVVNQQLEAQQMQMSESLMYALNIQKAVIPNLDSFCNALGSKFLINRPSQVVSGVTFWERKVDNLYMFCIGECGYTGIAGACMTMISASLLHEISAMSNDPAQILELLQLKFHSIFRKFNMNAPSAINSDISLCVMDLETQVMRFCGVKNPLVVMREGRMIQLNGEITNENMFTKKPETLEIKLKHGDMLYLMNSGITMQRGGNMGKEFSRERLLKLVADNHTLDVEAQGRIVNDAIDAWSGNRNQDADMVLIGIRY